MFNHVMIDIETLGVGTRPVILQIAAVMFSLDGDDGFVAGSNGGDNKYTFSVTLDDLSDQLGNNRDIDPATVCWWLSSRERRAVLSGMMDEFRMPQEGITLEDGLRLLRDWMINTYQELNPDLAAVFVVPGSGRIHNFYVWSKGTDFDIAILREAYAECDIKTPWEYNFVRDLRTFAEFAPSRSPNMPTIPSTPDQHDALSDACRQAAMVYHRLNG